MPLTSKGREIMSSMKGEYGEKRGESIFYASKNAGRIKGVDRAMSNDRRAIARFVDAASLPTLDAFCKCVRDGVRAGLPLSKVLNMGSTWTGERKSHGWQGRDARSVVRDIGGESWVNGKRTGYKIETDKQAAKDRRSAGMARDAVRRFVDADRVAGSLELGETSGKGQPMSGPQPQPREPDDNKDRHFFRGSARDAVRRIAARRAVPRRAL